MFSPGVWCIGLSLNLFGLFCPDIADVFVGREPLQGFKSLSEIVGHDEALQVLAKLVMAFIRHSPDDIQIRGNCTAGSTPRELQPLCSHPMA